MEAYAVEKVYFFLFVMSVHLDSLIDGIVNT